MSGTHIQQQPNIPESYEEWVIVDQSDGFRWHGCFGSLADVITQAQVMRKYGTATDPVIVRYVTCIDRVVAVPEEQGLQ